MDFKKQQFIHYVNYILSRSKKHNWRKSKNKRK